MRFTCNNPGFSLLVLSLWVDFTDAEAAEEELSTLFWLEKEDMRLSSLAAEGVVEREASPLDGLLNSSGASSRPVAASVPGVRDLEEGVDDRIPGVAELERVRPLAEEEGVITLDRSPEPAVLHRVSPLCDGVPERDRAPLALDARPSDGR